VNNYDDDNIGRNRIGQCNRSYYIMVGKSVHSMGSIARHLFVVLYYLFCNHSIRGSK